MAKVRDTTLPQHSYDLLHYGELPLSALPNGADVGDIFYFDGADWTVANLDTVGVPGASGSFLTVREQDGSPSVTGVTTIKISGGQVTDESGGVVLVEVFPVTMAVQQWDASVIDNVSLMVISGAQVIDNGNGQVTVGLPEVGVNFVFDGGGEVITTGVKGDILVPFDAEIQSATLLADVSGSFVVDIWRDSYANYPPTVADTITASAKPTLSSAIKSQDATLTGWTKNITAGDTMRFNVDSVSTVKRVTLALKLRRA